MGHESRIEPWSPHLTAFCFAGFGTDRLRCEEAMKTADRENPNRWTTVSSNRAPGAVGQNRSCSIQWAAKRENVQPLQTCFFLTSPFIELIRPYYGLFARHRAEWLVSWACEVFGAILRKANLRVRNVAADSLGAEC
jgi:hypothetical protein